MSLLLRPDIRPSDAPMLTLVMAQSVAIRRAILETTGLDVGIKWTNDLVYDRRKLCGILTEMSAEIDYINYVVIGVGINVNQPSFPEEIADRATSLMLEAGRTFLRAPLIAAVMERFEENCRLFLETRDLSGIQAAYNDLLVNVGEKVRVLEPGHEYSALSSGINKKGELLVQKEDGTTEAVFAGEVSVRGIYGYV